MRLLISGSTHFSLIKPHLERLRAESVLVSLSQEPDWRNLALAHKGYHLHTEDGPEQLLRIALSERVTAALSLSTPEDMNLRDARAARLLLEYGVPMITQNEEFVSLCADKFRCKQELLQRGVPCPEGHAADSLALARQVADVLSYPFLCKPANRWGGQGIGVIRNESELMAYYQTRKYKQTFIEEFVDGLEFSVETLVLPHRAIAMSPVLKGRTSLSGTHAMEHLRVAPYPCQGLQELALEIALKLGSCGLAEMEFIVGADGPKLVEVNPRISGVTRLSTLGSGVNPLELLVDFALGLGRSAVCDRPPLIAVEVPVMAAESLSADWDDVLRGRRGVSNVVLHRIGRTAGRIELSGDPLFVRVELRDILALGIVTLPPLDDLDQALEVAERFRSGGGLVLSRDL